MSSRLYGEPQSLLQILDTTNRRRFLIPVSNQNWRSQFVQRVQDVLRTGNVPRELREGGVHPFVQAVGSEETRQAARDKNAAAFVRELQQYNIVPQRYLKSEAEPEALYVPIAAVPVVVLALTLALAFSAAAVVYQVKVITSGSSKLEAIPYVRLAMTLARTLGDEDFAHAVHDHLIAQILAEAKEHMMADPQASHTYRPMFSE